MNLYLIIFSEVAQINIQCKKKKKNKKQSQRTPSTVGRHATLESVGDHSGEHQLIIF